jgi:branched-chain amino acid transport system ATP-binding protein
MLDTMIDAHNVEVECERSRQASVRALRGLTLTDQRGESLAVTGSNGDGATMPPRCLTGFVRLWSGRLLVDGADVTSCQARDRRFLRRRVRRCSLRFDRPASGG